MGKNRHKIDTVIFGVSDNGNPVASNTLLVPIEVRAKIMPPDSVKNIIGVSRISGEFKFKWNTAKNTDRYSIYRSADTVSSNFVVVATTFDTFFTTTIKDSAFNYYVVATNSKGNSVPSPIISSTSINTAPQWKHVVVNAEVLENSTITINFADSVSDSNGDKITYQMIAGNPLKNSLVFSTWTNTATYEDSGSYTIKIQASDGIAPPSVMTIQLHVKNVNRAPAFVANLPLASYSVAENSLLAFPVKAIDPDGDNSVITIQSATVKRPASITIANDTLKWMSNYGDSGSYQIVLKASDSRDSSIKTIAIIVGKSLPVPAVPGLLAPLDGASGLTTAPTLIWNAVNLATSYHYQIALSNAFTSIVVQDSTLTDTVKSLSGLSKGVQYFWRVAAKNTTGKSDWSGIKSFTTIRQFALTSNATNGTITQTPGNSPYDSGSTVGLKAIPSTGYKFANWSGDASGTNDSTTVIMNAAKNIMANFALKTFTITINTASNGSISGSATVNYNSSPSYSITPATGYKVTDVLVDNVSVGPVTTYTFSNVVANHTISATFAINTFSITATAGSNGSISPSGATPVAYGTNQTYTITPAANYHVATLIVDNNSVTAATSYVFQNVTSTHTIAVTFALNTYTLSIIANHGTVTQNPTPTGGKYDYGTQVTLTPTANAGYLFNGWSGANFSDISNANAILMNGDKAITANFTVAYTITFNPQGGSAVAPKVVLANTASGTLPVSTFAGCDAAGWMVDSTGQGADFNASTIVTQNITVYAKWTVQDLDKNVYKTVRIGTQTWMAENLRATQFSDHTPIQSDNGSSWYLFTSPAFCYYNGTSNLDTIKYFGALYNGFAAVNSIPFIAGWHVPTDADFTALANSLGGASVAGVKLKETGVSHWNSPNSGTNSSGFTALPVGSCDAQYGYFTGFGSQATFWSSITGSFSVIYNSDNAFYIGDAPPSQKKGCSIRLVKN